MATNYALERALKNYTKAWWCPDATAEEIARLKKIYEDELKKAEKNNG